MCGGGDWPSRRGIRLARPRGRGRLARRGASRDGQRSRRAPRRPAFRRVRREGAGQRGPARPGEQRRARVAEIVAAGGAKTGDDYHAAALVYQHGQELEDYARAREYAARAVELGNENGRWLAAAACDRWLRRAGYPQRFGTQYSCNPDCVLQEWDPNTTNEERARWNVPPLEEALHMMDGR